MAYKILIVEDDVDINGLLSKIMKKQGYETVQAFSGTEAELRLFQQWGDSIALDGFNLILLDLMLPGMNGEELLVKIREISDIPVIVLSAKSGLESKVSVLNDGADDYITKPFEVDEVIARVNGTLKRYEKYHNIKENSLSINSSKDLNMSKSSSNDLKDKNDKNKYLVHKRISLNTESREVALDGESLELTVYEFEILKLFMENPNKVFSRESIYEIIWNGNFYGEDNTVNMHISNLRKKIAGGTNEEYIKTVWGIGYKLV